MAEKPNGSRWLWLPHKNLYTGFADTPTPCVIVSPSSFTVAATRRWPQQGPFDYVVRLDDGAKVYAFDHGLAPLPAPASVATPEPRAR